MTLKDVGRMMDDSVACDGGDGWLQELNFIGGRRGGFLVACAVGVVFTILLPSGVWACDTCAHCRSMPASSNLEPIESAPEPASGLPSFRFGVVGDTQGLQYVEQLITDMNAHDPSLAVFPGDLVSVGSNNAWSQWDQRTQHFVGGADRRLMVPGNHDLPVGGDANWQQAFPWLPDSQTVGGLKGIDQMDYYYDFGNTRFISITTDSQVQGAGGPPAALGWLENVLNDPTTQAKDHVFVYSHHPITFNNYDATGGTAGDWWQAMGNADNVRGVFVGHWHQYQPSQPHPHHDTWEVIVGTGNSGFSGHPWQNEVGYSIVEVEGPRATLKFYGDRDQDGSYDDLLDSFVMADVRPGPAGIVAHFGFEDSAVNRETALSPLGKVNSGSYFGNATTASGGAVGRALSLDGNRDFADGHGIGDYNLAILEDLTISIQANFSELRSGPGQNTFVSYTADVAGYTDREEAVNQPYNFRIRSDKKLEVFWERNNNEKLFFVSTAAADVAADAWHEYRFTRDVENGLLNFYVDGLQLGDALSFDPLLQLPTGGAQGTLRIGINYDRDQTAKLVGEFSGMLDELGIWNEVTMETYTGPTPGDVNLDGVLDQADITAFIHGWRTVDFADNLLLRWNKGDLDLSGESNLEDIVIFQRALRDVGLHFPGIPEPSSHLLTICGCALVGLARRRGSCVRVALRAQG